MEEFQRLSSGDVTAEHSCNFSVNVHGIPTLLFDSQIESP